MSSNVSSYHEYFLLILLVYFYLPFTQCRPINSMNNIECPHTFSRSSGREFCITCSLSWRKQYTWKEFTFVHGLGLAVFLFLLPLSQILACSPLHFSTKQITKTFILLHFWCIEELLFCHAQNNYSCMTRVSFRFPLQKKSLHWFWDCLNQGLTFRLVLEWASKWVSIW